MTTIRQYAEKEKSLLQGQQLIKTFDSDGRSRYTLSRAEGEMLCWNLYPGIRISYNRFDTKEDLPSDQTGRSIIEMNYCINGSHECVFGDKSSGLLKKNDFCISTDGDSLEKACFPGGKYTGIGIYLDTDIAGNFLKREIPGISVDIGGIVQRLCSETNVFY